MYVQTELTPNPNSLKFLPGKKVSNSGSYEITNKDDVDNELVRNILSVNGVEGIFLGQDFISVNKKDNINWDEIKHIVISLINDFYAGGKEFVIDKDLNETENNLGEIELRLENKYQHSVLDFHHDVVPVVHNFACQKTSLDLFFGGNASIQNR